jgi:hypothetical protein
MFSLKDITSYRSTLGLLPVPLFHGDKKRYVLLNGGSGNFCLDIGHDASDARPSDLSWSSSVGHYISVVKDKVVLYSWDPANRRREFELQRVQGSIGEFHDYLQRNEPPSAVSIVEFSLRTLRMLRSAMPQDSDHEALGCFLFLLSCAIDDCDRSELDLDKWSIAQSAANAALAVGQADWDMIMDYLKQGVKAYDLKPDFTLVMRHASGQLFQEAHLELDTSCRQLTLDGFPEPLRPSKGVIGIGVHYTPQWLARSLVEETLRLLPARSKTISIFDPACGSGELLREVIRQLRLSGYTGNFHVKGWDISSRAVEMARFILHYETSSKHADIDIETCDSMAQETTWPDNVDLVVMNPPFVSWTAMNAIQRASTKYTLGNLCKGQPDYCCGFLWRAFQTLSKNGALGAIIPASILDAISYSKLRQEIASHFCLATIARPGNQYIFSGAMVDIGFIASSRSAGIPTTMIWTDTQTESSFCALRTLRRLRETAGNKASYEDAHFSIYTKQPFQSWVPRKYTSLQLIEHLSNSCQTLDSLYMVHQGALTGLNDAFLLTRTEWQQLPDREQKYFRPAIMNESISNGRLQCSVYVFYPYGRFVITHEEELKKRLVCFFTKHLKPCRERLIKRTSEPNKSWWMLHRERPWQHDPRPKIVSTYFGAAGSFAYDGSGEYVVVQGYAWLPKSLKQVAVDKPNLALLAIVNSQVMNMLLPGLSSQVAGGQWNLSLRYLKKLPLPNCMVSSVVSDQVQKLSLFGTLIQSGASYDAKELDNLVYSAYAFKKLWMI